MLFNNTPFNYGYLKPHFLCVESVWNQVLLVFILIWNVQRLRMMCDRAMLSVAFPFIFDLNAKLRSTLGFLSFYLWSYQLIFTPLESGIEGVFRALFYVLHTVLITWVERSYINHCNGFCNHLYENHSRCLR